MNCKNCNHQLKEGAHFCENCGAKVVLDRITFKGLLLELFINVFGFDSKFFYTLRMVAIQPHIVLSEVLSGVRKRYMNPFAFLAVGAAISLLVFNYFQDDFKAVNSDVNSAQIEELQRQANLDLTKLKDVSKNEMQKLAIQKKSAELQLKFLDGMMNFMLHYYNWLTFVFVFFYALLSKWTFWKPHNFGEHIIMNAYIFGFTLYVSLILFFLSMAINPAIYTYSMFLYIVFYMFAFGKLYKLSIGRNFLKLLRFLVGLLILFIALFFAIVAISITAGYFGWVKL